MREHTPEQSWLVKVIWDEPNPEGPRFLLKATHVPGPQDWTEFKHQDDLLRHLWHLLDTQAGLR